MELLLLQLRFLLIEQFNVQRYSIELPGSLLNCVIDIFMENDTDIVLVAV